jgi:Ser/Thr protein kinase RdoA (MazF antagonist)
MTAGGLVHGMGKDLVEPDWPALTPTEVSSVLAHFAAPGAGPAPRSGSGEGDLGARTLLTWRSPRPMSAAALARSGDGTVFVKRHHTGVRSATQLAVEHAFITHLGAQGMPVPAVRRTHTGATTLTCGEFVYEVHDAVPGVDLYRDAMSWTPFAGLGHARAAGAALARLHQAAAGFSHEARAPGVLINSCAVVTAADPLAEVDAMLGRRPGLRRYLGGRAWRADLARHLLPAIHRAAPLLAALEPQWGHGDWHPSNLSWDCAAPDAQVAGVFDFGLANRTFTVHDLAIAIERSTVGWLDLAETGRAEPDLDAVDALLDGYQEVRPLTRAETAALAEVLPVVHLEYALSEIEYFAGVVHSPANADLAYGTYLIGHARWFTEPEGSALLGHLRQRPGRR